MKHFYALIWMHLCWLMSGATGNYFDTNTHTQVIICVSQVVTFNLQLGYIYSLEMIWQYEC